MEDRAKSSRALLPLLLGAAFGVALAAYGVARPSAAHGALASGVIASVNGVAIRAEDRDRALAALDLERREGAAEGDPQRVLDRLIDEELLVQRALALGLERRDTRARSALVSATIASITLEAESTPPSEQALREHFNEHAEYFRGSDLVRVEQLFFGVASGGDDAAARERARAARARLIAGAEPREIAADPPPAPLPSEAIPATKLIELLGPTAGRAALETAPGGVSEPARSGSGYHVLRVRERRAAHLPRFESVRAQVLLEYRRRAGERRLRSVLDSLRSESELVIAEGAR